MDISFLGCRCFAGVDDNQFWGIGSTSAIEDSHPQYSLLRSNIVSDVQNSLGGVEVGIRTRLSICSEGHLQRGGGCRRTQPRVSVHMGRSQPCLTEYSQRVVFFYEELPGSIEANGTAGVLIANFFCASNNQVH